MKREDVAPPGSKGVRLLAYLTGQIASGRIQKRKPETFITYSEALDALGIPQRGRAGQQLRREGLGELIDWTIANPDLPKITGLIVDKKDHHPGKGYPKAFGREGANWEEWWLAETDKAIDFDWSPYLADRNATSEPSLHVREDEGRDAPDYRAIITIEPDKCGGRACIRGMRITVGDILGWLAAGMSEAEILQEHSDLTQQDIRASLAYAADREEEANEAARKISRLSRYAEKWKGEFTLPESDPDDPRMDYLLERYWRHRR
jgi:uncharacterized protein (DUF433 family)